MVDAIGAVGSEQIRPSKKDNAINWKQCTSDEIIEYEKQGQEVPDYILQWAQEIAKLENAPEDITYEMAMGATTMDGINQSQQNGEEANTNDKIDPNNATAVREKMTAEGASTQAQAKSFRNYSDQYSEEINNMMETMEKYISQSEIASSESQTTKDDVMARIQSLLASRNKSKTGDVTAALDSARVDRDIRSIGQSGLNTIQTLSSPVDNALEQVGTAEFTSITGRNFGNETVKIGQEPELNGGFLAAVGQMTIKTGENELKQSDAGDKQFAENRGENSQHRGIVTDSEDEIRRASGASIPDNDSESDIKDKEDKVDSDKTVNDSEKDQTAKESENKQEELALQDPDTVDEKITTDPNEILKRKQRKGLA